MMDVFCITLTLYKVSVLHPEIDWISESRKPGVSEDKKTKTNPKQQQEKHSSQGILDTRIAPHNSSQYYQVTKH